MDELAVPLPVSVMVASTQTDVMVLVMVGKGLIVTAFFALHPLMLVKVISTVPALIPVITPNLLTLAIVLSDDSQGLFPSGTSALASAIVLPTHTLFNPFMVGSALTVNVMELLQSVEV